MTSAVLQRHSRVEQATQRCRSAFEGQIGDDLEGHARERNSQQVVLENSNLGKTPSQRGSQCRVDLHRDHGRSAAHECSGQSTGPGAEVEDEVARSDTGCANEFRGELATTEKVLAAPARSRSNGHGKPPRP